MYVFEFSLQLLANVFFDFDACDYTNPITTAIQSFAFADALESILHKHLDPALDEVTIFPVSFTDNIKSAIVSAAEVKVDHVQTKVIQHLEGLSRGCNRRHLGETEVQQDGTQRMLQGGLLFNDFAGSFEVIIEGVVSSSPICII